VAIYSPKVWGGKSSSEVRDKVSVGGLGDEASQKLKQFADIVYRF